MRRICIKIEQNRHRGETMSDQDRRREERIAAARLRNELNMEQRMTLNELERFGWELKFIRRPPFQESIAVVFDGDHKTYAVLRADGTLDEDPGFEIRH